jgi:indoleamine 2,3-dioxygenase
MYESCRANIFYHRVRPFLKGWPDDGIVYEGVNEEPKIFIGGSAAQSSLLQTLDAGLGITHPSDNSGPFLIQMRKYMPPNHSKVISLLELDPILPKYLNKNRSIELKDAYEKCVSGLNIFRKKHLEMAIHYISDQAKKGKEGEGTGGTEFITFLTTAKKETYLQMEKE